MSGKRAPGPRRSASGCRRSGSDVVAELIEAGYERRFPLRRHEARVEAVARNAEQVFLGQVEGSGASDVIVAEIATEIRWIIAVYRHLDAGAIKCGKAVLGQRREDAQLDVGERADGKRYLMLDEIGDQVGILDGAD